MLACVELRHLRYFVAVAEEQNVTRAAARLHVSQPPLSRQVRDLENEIGVALFDHGPKAVRLTEAGRAFLDEARAVLRRAEQAVETAKAVAEGRKGELHIGYAPSLTAELLPRALKAFQQSHPDVRVQLHDLSTREMLRGLREGRLHAALLIRVTPRALDGLVFEELRRYAVRVVMSPSHPLARVRKLGLDRVAEHPLIAFTLADYPEHHAWIAGLFASLDRPPRIAEEHDSATSLIASIEAGRGVALVQEGIQCLTGSRLKISPLFPPPPPLSVGIAYPAHGRPAVTDRFVAAAKGGSAAARRDA